MGNSTFKRSNCHPTSIGENQKQDQEEIAEQWIRIHHCCPSRNNKFWGGGGGSRGPGGKEERKKKKHAGAQLCSEKDLEITGKSMKLALASIIVRLGA